jgi:methanogenic corrinoid protein MtbC1
VEAEAVSGGQSSLAGTRSLFLQAILGGHRQAAVQVAEEALWAGHAVQDVYVEVFQDALHEVGRLWEANRITVAEEHMATAITQYVLARMYPRLGSSAVSRGRMVLTGVEGELHQVGANMVADVLEADGWDVRFLGSNLPAAGIVQAVEEHRAQVLAVSCTLFLNVARVRALLEAVRDKLGPQAPRILLGGGAFRPGAGSDATLDAHVVSGDLRQAVAVTRSWPRELPR